MRDRDRERRRPEHGHCSPARAIRGSSRTTSKQGRSERGLPNHSRSEIDDERDRARAWFGKPDRRSEIGKLLAAGDAGLIQPKRIALAPQEKANEPGGGSQM